MPRHDQHLDRVRARAVEEHSRKKERHKSVSGESPFAIVFQRPASLGDLFSHLATPRSATLAGQWVACHQLTGQYQGIPPIVAWPEETFVAVMNGYRLKLRPNAVMQTIAGKLSDEEIAALAAYFGSLPAPLPQ
jgi:cytochrome c553